MCLTRGWVTGLVCYGHCEGWRRGCSQITLGRTCLSYFYQHWTFGISSMPRFVCGLHDHRYTVDMLWYTIAYFEFHFRYLVCVCVLRYTAETTILPTTYILTQSGFSQCSFISKPPLSKLHTYTHYNILRLKTSSLSIVLTVMDQKPQNHKKWHYSPSHRLNVDVMLSNISFLFFLRFLSPLILWINCCFYWISLFTRRVQ